MRIGINIPNELHRRLEPLKGNINVSQICRDAIQDRIRCYEKALVIRSNMNIVQAIERVWVEERNMRAIVEVDWGMLGCEDAESWVTVARLKDWDYLHRLQDVIRRQERPRWEVPPPHLEGVKTYHERMAELDYRIQQQDDQFLDWLYDEHGGIDRKAAEQEYMSAWLAYNDSAWDLFCQMRVKFLEERRHERLRVRQDGPGPTVPTKLLHELDAKG